MITDHAENNVQESRGGGGGGGIKETEIGQLGSLLDLLSCVLPPPPLWLKFEVGYINQTLDTNLILLKLE